MTPHTKGEEEHYLWNAFKMGFGWTFNVRLLQNNVKTKEEVNRKRKENWRFWDFKEIRWNKEFAGTKETIWSEDFTDAPLCLNVTYILQKCMDVGFSFCSGSSWFTWNQSFCLREQLTACVQAVKFIIYFGKIGPITTQSHCHMYGTNNMSK